MPYPKGLGPSQRFRVEVYFEALEAAAIRYDYRPFLREKAYKRLYDKGAWLFKAWSVIMGFCSRLILMTQLGRYTQVFVQREASPLGPPIFEWLITRVWRKPLIYDLDDAIWIPNYAEANSNFQGLKYYGKVDAIMRWSSRVIAGNEFLAKRSRLFNDEVVVIPTVVDTEHYHQPAHKGESTGGTELVLGWTGTHSTNQHLEYIAPVLEKLTRQYDFKIRLISNKQPKLALDNVEYIQWSRDTEIEDLRQIDIGLMPLIPDCDFAEGKCGFKAIQYMALEIPVIVSPLGVNSTIVQHGFNGYLCETLEEWEIALRKLIEADQASLASIAVRGRQTIEQAYSLKSQSKAFISAISA